MRSCLVLLGSISASCAAPQSSFTAAAYGTTVSLEGVVPVYARYAFPHTESRGMTAVGRRGRPMIETYGYRAGTGVYIGRHLVAATIAVLPPEDGSGVTVLDMNGAVFAGDPYGRRATVSETVEHGAVVLMRTDEAGVPVPLRSEAAVVGERLLLARFEFAPPMRRGGLAEPVARIDAAVVAKAAYDTLLGPQRTFELDIGPRPGELGAAVIDAEGQLIGITVYRSGGRLSALTVRVIRGILREARAE